MSDVLLHLCRMNGRERDLMEAHHWAPWIVLCFDSLPLRLRVATCASWQPGGPGRAELESCWKTPTAVQLRSAEATGRVAGVASCRFGKPTG